jgi:hypothetical protein
MSELDIDPEEEREELIQETEHAKRQAEQKQAEILDAVKQEEEITHDQTEWVELGEAEFEVKCEMPGEVTDTLENIDPDNPQNGPSMREVVDAVKHMVVMVRSGDLTMQTDSEISGFFDHYYDEHGTTVLQAAMTKLLEPALESQQGMVDQSFQGQRHGSNDGFRDGRRPK